MIQAMIDFVAPLSVGETAAVALGAVAVLLILPPLVCGMIRAEGEKAAEEELSRLREAAAAAKKAADESAKGAKAADKGRKDAEKALAAAKAEAEAARRDLKELKDNPEVPKEVMDKLRAQFAAAAVLDKFMKEVNANEA